MGLNIGIHEVDLAAFLVPKIASVPPTNKGAFFASDARAQTQGTPFFGKAVPCNQGGYDFERK
jgi:hypothetical protein